VEVEQQENLEDAFQGLFKSSATGTGEEELLRIASDYALQINANQIKTLLFLESLSNQISNKQGIILKNFVERWLEIKRHNNSDAFVMKALEFISLRRFLSESSFKVNIEK